MARAVTIRVSGMQDTLDALSPGLGDDAEIELNKANREIALVLQGRISSAALAEGRQAAALAGTVRVRATGVYAGGSGLITSSQKPAYKLLFGSEFGATVLKQYKPHLGRGSYWFFKTVEESAEIMDKFWADAADAVTEKFGRGG